MKKMFTAVLLAAALLSAAFPRGVSAEEGGIAVHEVGSCVYGVPERTTLSRFADAYFRPVFIIKKPDGKVLDNDEDFLGTGFSLLYECGPGEYRELSFVILGDLDGSGRVASDDYLNIRAYMKGSTALSEIKRRAADINGDKNLSTYDYALVKSHFQGKYDIYANQVIPSESSGAAPEPTNDPWTSGWA